MRKTVTITIGGALFHIEEEAFGILDQYLRSIREHFGTYPDHDEIVSDIEGRIAEEFSDALKSAKRAAVSQADVDQLIARMGTVEDFKAFDVSDTPLSREIPASEPRKGRLYRDADDKILGGVSAGIAKFVGIDPVFMRLAFGLSVLIGGFGVLLYILLWAILPEAKTAAEKVEMTQGAVTLSAIEKRINEVVRTEKTQSTLRRIVALPFDLLRRIFSAIGAVIRVIVPLIARVIGFFIVIGVAIGITAATFFFLVFLLHPSSPYIGFPLKETLGAVNYTILLSSGYALVVLPLILLLLGAASLMMLRRLPSMPAVIALTCTWLMALLVCGVTAFSVAPTLEVAVEKYESENHATVRKTIELSDFTGIEMGGHGRVEVKQGDDYLVVLEAPQRELDASEVVINEGVLSISRSAQDDPCLFFCGRSGITAYITMPTLESIELAGIAQSEVRGFETESTDISLSGHSYLDAYISAETLNAAISGVSHLELHGTGSTLTIELSGPSSLEAYDYVTRSAQVELSGPAHASINASEAITGEASGPASVYYKQMPTRLEVETYGPASVQQWDGHGEGW